MAAAAVDTALISSFSSIPQPQIESLIESPTTDALLPFLQALVTKITEHESLKSEKLRLDVELENAVRGGESRARVLKENQDKALKQVEELTSKLNSAENARAELETRLQDQQTSSSKSSTETQALQNQVAKLERSNRDTLSLLNAKTTSYDKLAEDLSNQHQKTVELRREIASLEERSQNAENAVSSSKMRESAIKTEIESLKRNNDWLQSELTTKNDEHTKFRKEKTARITQLQRANEDHLQNVESLQRTEASLRKRVEELNQKAEDAFTKIQHMQEEAARKEEDFRSELDNARRLSDLQKQSADTARRRVQELEDEVEQVRDDAANEISQIQAELETERQGRETSEHKAEELEAELAKVNSELGASQQRRDVNATPRGRAAGHMTPNAPGSPAAFTPSASSRLRAGMTFTQLYAEYNTLKSELDEERRNHTKLRETFDELLRDLEQKQPELQEAQFERDRLEGEVDQMSSLLEAARQEKEAARREARKFQSQVEGHDRRARMLEQQLRDLSAQVKILLVEIRIREQGEQLSALEREQLQEAARLASDGASFEGMSDTGLFISQHLVTFKDVFELQSKNMELTKIVRELGERREEDESKAREEAHAKDKAELEELTDRVERYKDEVKSLVTQSQSYIRERDMFRRMLSHRGQLPPDADLESMFGNSVNGAGAPQTPRNPNTASTVEQTPHSKDLSDYSRLLKELQNHFDTYRRESAADYSTIKAQADQLSREKNQLQSEVARANSQVTLSQERYEMLQANYDQLKSEEAEFRKRYESLSENAARQDIRTQQVAEELVEAKALAESIRNENANLKAEKDLWKRIESRLNEDNQNLVEERGRLNKMISDNQHLSNERELADSETRRKLQNQVESLDSELQSLKKKLEEETEANRSASLRREYEQEQNRTRIDDLVKSLSNAKEELASSKTTRDQLQSRVDELKIELRTAEERTQALQPRPTPRNTATAEAPEADNDALSQEQQLAFEIANMKRELDLSKAEVENARVQIEQYKAISQSSEEELQSLNETLDQYKEDSDKVTQEKDTKIQDLEQRLEDISTELSSTNDQLSELRSANADNQTRLDQQRANFETEIAQVKDECERYKETASYHQADLKAQAELTQQAQQSYEAEVVKHGEAAKMLQTVRNELNQIKTEVSQAKADAEAARTTLAQNEESWTSTKERYESELIELKVRRDDVAAQNKLLHEQLENVSTQISSLQQTQAQNSQPAAEDAEQTSSPSSSSNLQNLQEVIKYLRREKEIVDVQHELSVQEAKRLKQQLDYTRSQLEEVRTKLDQEHQRRADTEQSSINHKKLMDTINELNVFRESSVTLRNEARQAQSQLSEKSKQVEDLSTRIQPLQASVRELENEKESLQGEMKLLEEDRNRWQQRHRDVLQKYDRIDPAELEELKDRLSKTEGDRDQAVTEKETLQTRVNDFDEEIKNQREEAKKELRERLTQQFKTRSKEQQAQITAERSEKQALQTQLDELKAELENVKSSTNEANPQTQTAANETESAIPSTTPNPDVNMTDVAEDGQVSQTTLSDEELTQLRNQLSTSEQMASERLQQVEKANAEANDLRARISVLENRIKELESHARTSPSAQPADDTTQSEHADTDTTLASRLKELLNPVEADLQSLKDTLMNMQNQGLSTEQANAVNELLVQVDAIENLLTKVHAWATSEPRLGDKAAQIQTESALEAQVAQIRSELEATYKQRVDNMRKQLSTKLSEGKTAYREQINKENQEQIDTLQKQLEEARGSTTTTSTQQAEQATPSTPVGPAQLSTPSTGVATGGGETSTDESNFKVKTETNEPPEQWNLPQVQSFITNNPHVKNLMARNLKTRLDQETAKVKSQAENDTAEKLKDANQKAEEAKKQAVFLEGKKSGVKLNMAENKVKNITAKLDVVEKAATDTPQRPVGEVWAIAKNAKAAPVAPVAPQSPAQQTSAAPQQSVESQTTPSQAVTSPAGTENQPQVQEQTSDQQTSATTEVSMEQSQPAAAQVEEAKNVEASPMPSSTEQQNNDTTLKQGGAPHLTAQLPNKPVQTNTKSSQQQAGHGTGPAALRGAVSQGSGIPRGGTSIRGTANARGGGANTNANANVNAGAPPGSQLPQRGGSALPRGGRGGSIRGRGNAQQGGGTMNAGARQFVPGNKRPREDGSGDAGNTKRQRGGGPSA